MSCGLQAVDALGKPGEADAAPLEKPRAAPQDFALLGPRDRAFSADRLEGAHLRRCRAALERRIHDGLRERMLGGALRRGGYFEQLLLAPFLHYDLSNGGAPLGPLAVFFGKDFFPLAVAPEHPPRCD